MGAFSSGVVDKPICREIRDAIERSRLFEKMGRARNDLQFSLAMHLGQRAMVEVDDRHAKRRPLPSAVAPSGTVSEPLSITAPAEI